MQTLTQTIPWISLAISIYALYHSIKKDRLHGKIDQIHRRADLQKRVSKLQLGELPKYLEILSSSETKCKSCSAFSIDAYELIKSFLLEFKNSTDSLSERLRNPTILKNRLQIEETVAKIEIIETFFEHLKENIRKRSECSIFMREANKANATDANNRAAD